MKLAKYNLVLIVLAVIFVSSCNTHKQIQEVPVKTEIQYVEKMVSVEMPADSSSIIALFKCDSTNQVILQELNESKSKRVVSQHSLQKGKFIYKTSIVRDTVFIPTKELIIKEQKPITIEKTTIVNKLKLWQKILMCCGGLFIILFIIAIIKIIRNNF